MIQQLIQRHLMERAKAAGYISHVGGLIESVIKPDGDKYRKVPAYRSEGSISYTAALPDNNESAVLFFRQVGNLNWDSSKPHIEAYTGRLRAVLWYNADLLQDVEGGPNLAGLFAGTYKDFGIVSRAVVKVAAAVSQEEAFGEYRGFDLSEQETQFLAHPFNMCAVDLSVFIVAKRCKTNPIASGKIC